MKIPRSIVDGMIDQARKEAPLEACGYLAGKDGNVLRPYEMTNVDKSEEHFSLDPEEQFDVMRKTRDEGLDILAVYHSHPASPARPSPEDIKLAYDPGISYVIVSILAGWEDVRSFKIKNASVEKEHLEVVDDRV